MFAAASRINLAVVNSVPLPALDGGQMVFTSVEALSRRKADQRLQENITSAAVLAFIFLSLMLGGSSRNNGVRTKTVADVRMHVLLSIHQNVIMSRVAAHSMHM